MSGPGFTLHFATINTKFLSDFMMSGPGFTLHFATINTLIIPLELGYLIEIYITFCYY